jgi:hypothetical protein
MLVSVYALDAAVRDPLPRRVALAALACALTVCVKYSAVVLAPIVAGLVAMEALSGRWSDARWRRGLAIAVPVFALVGWLVIALLYSGDWTLADFRAGLREISRSSTSGRVAFLLGERNVGGWWYFFPVALALKTPVALHVLAALALVAGLRAARSSPWRDGLAHPARAPLLAVAIFLAGLMVSRINIGTRHALPMMPFAMILVALGVRTLWGSAARGSRIAIAAVTAAFGVATLAHYPWFLSYTSEYARGRPLHETIVDSSTDWGQGLVALREFMRARGIDRVALAYFGSALPEGYGIAYVPLPSFLELPAQAPGAPRYLVVSATLLAGSYVKGDPYAALRPLRPAAIVADTLYVYDGLAALPR